MERTPGSRLPREVTRGQTLETSAVLFSAAPPRTGPRAWQWRPVEKDGRRWFVVNGERGSASQGRPRKKAVLMGAAIGAGVGAAGGGYAVYATGGDADPWVVPAFAGVGAAVGAVCGFLISLL